MSGLNNPGRVPAPHSFDPRWAGALTDFLQRFFDGLKGDIEVQGRFITRGGRRRRVTYVTDATYTALLTDEIIVVNRAGTVAITLPEAPPNGTSLMIADGGNAGSYPITIQRQGSTDTIGAATSVEIASPYRWVEFLYSTDLTAWLAR